MFNKDFGQHILKNPLVTTSIVEKARAPVALDAYLGFSLDFERFIIY